MRMHKECTYCKFDAPHLSVTLSEWSSEDRDCDKAKAREQCPPQLKGIRNANTEDITGQSSGHTAKYDM